TTSPPPSSTPFPYTTLFRSDVFVRVPIADAAIDDPLAGDDPEAGPFPRTSEGPLGNEVRAAHVPGEERGDDLELRARRDVRDGAKMAERLVRDREGFRLKVLPEEEEAHDVRASAAYAREVARDLLGVEPSPPPHRA